MEQQSQLITHLEDRETPTEFTFTNADGVEETLRLPFNQDSNIATRGDKKGKTLKAVQDLFDSIPGFKLQGCLGGLTRILLSAVKRPLALASQEKLMVSRDAAFLERGGILVPQKQVLAYTRAQVLRHQIMASKGQWGEQSASTKKRKNSAKGEETRAKSIKKGTHKGSKEPCKRSILAKAKWAADKKAAGAISTK